MAALFVFFRGVKETEGKVVVLCPILVESLNSLPTGADALCCSRKFRDFGSMNVRNCGKPPTEVTRFLRNVYALGKQAIFKNQTVAFAI